MGKFIKVLIFVIALGVFGYSAYNLAHYAWETKKTVEGIEVLAGMIETEDETITVEEGGKKKTAEEKKAAMQKKYRRLYEANNDFAGWLKIKDTGIDNPVMFTPEDPEYYLRKNFDGDYDIAGMLFIDYRTCLVEGYRSLNTIIYGHRMNNMTMFGPLRNYKEDEYVAEHKIVQFDTLDRPGKYEIFAVILSQAYSAYDDVFKYYDHVDLSTQEEYDYYLENIKALSVYYDDEAAPVFGTEILTLSTCDYYKEDGRLAVLAKRLPD